jgi:hypothetical protein
MVHQLLDREAATLSAKPPVVPAVARLAFAVEARHACANAPHRHLQRPSLRRERPAADVGRIAEVLARLEPDIVALQELDVGRARTGGVDQAHEIARRLDMACHFHAALKVEEELYGDAILTALPERLIQVGPLPGHPRMPVLEPRGALWVEADVDGRALQVINTHLGLVPREQQIQAAHLAGPSWLDHPRFVGRGSCWAISTPRPPRWSTAPCWAGFPRRAAFRRSSRRPPHSPRSCRCCASTTCS